MISYGAKLAAIKAAFVQEIRDDSVQCYLRVQYAMPCNKPLTANQPLTANEKTKVKNKVVDIPIEHFVELHSMNPDDLFGPDNKVSCRSASVCGILHKVRDSSIACV